MESKIKQSTRIESNSYPKLVEIAMGATNAHSRGSVALVTELNKNGQYVGTIVYGLGSYRIGETIGWHKDNTIDLHPIDIIELSNGSL